MSPRAAGAVATAGPTSTAAEPEATNEAQELTWRWDDSPVGKMVVVVSIPATREPLPVLITMHGLGESRKGPDVGARGWLDDYGLARGITRLANPPITNADYQRLGGLSRRRALNESLIEQPYRGLIVVMPYTPDILAPDRSLDGAKDLGRFIIEVLLPRIHRDTPAIRTPEATGIDGVSLGGRAALLVGLEHAEHFAAVGTLQAAIYPHERDELVRRVGKARGVNPSLRLRLLTSDGDFYRGTLATLSKALETAGHDHRFDLASGPHGYAFNRGPGLFEMLLFHDRVLRKEKLP
jgi:iron(III)-salmochelin esterase